MVVVKNIDNSYDPNAMVRNKKGHDRRGGVAVICCKYLLTCHYKSYDKVYRYFTESLDELSFQGEEVVKKRDESSSCPF